MADENQTTPEADTPAPANAADGRASAPADGANATAAPSAAAAAPAAPAPPPGPTAEEFAELKDKLLRGLADAENVRRRAERDVADTRQYAVTSFAREMLQVGDNLRRALEAVPADKRKEADPTLAALLEGVEVTERILDQTMAKFGVKRIEAKGKKFDPSFHQAMFELPREDVPPGTVIDEMQAGYLIGERVLKPALVVVAKRPPVAANDDLRKNAPADADASNSGNSDDGA
jgi:molecular chaperone GrpE